MLKRFLSLMLALSMVLSLACVSVFAAEEADAPQNNSAEVVAEAVEEPEGEQTTGSEDISLNTMADEVWAKDYQTSFEVGVHQKLKIGFSSTIFVDGMRRTMSFKSSDKSIVEIADKAGGGSTGAAWVRIKGLKEGTAVLTATVKGGFADSANKGKVFCSTQVTITVKGSGSTDPKPDPDPEPSKTPVIESSESSVQLKTNGEHTVLISTNLDRNQYDHINANRENGIVSGSTKWANDTSFYLTLKGLEPGSDVITLTLEGTQTNGEKVLASTKIKVTVTGGSGSSDTSKPGKTGLKVKKATKKLISLSWNKVSKASGYEVCLSIKGNPQTFRVKKTSYKINLTGGKSKLAYTVKVRAYRTVNGKTIYGKWTTKKGKLK